MSHVVRHREHFRQHSSWRVKEPQGAFYTAPSIVMPNPSLKDLGVTLSLHTGYTNAIYASCTACILYALVRGKLFIPTFFKIVFFSKMAYFFPKVEVSIL